MTALKIERIPRYNYDDYILWEDNWELIDGYPYAMSPAPMIKHQSISAKIARVLSEAFDGCQKCQVLMPIDWKISDDTVVQPDNSVICHTPKNEAYISIAPKIIFEILSKSTAKKDVTVKFDLYEKEGVKYYIIIDPNSEVAKIYHLQNGKYIKLCDVNDKVVDFYIEECDKKIEFDFSKIF
jgi:Uma2 family endonuclease